VPISRFDASDFATRIAGEARDFDVEQFLPAKDARKMDRFIQLGMAAGIEAMQDSGLEVNDSNSHRFGAYIGSGIGGIESIENTTQTWLEKGPRRVSPFYVPGSIINMIAGNLSIMFGLRGPNLAMVTACTTATHAIGDAARMIEYGDADAMLAGGAEAGITPTAVAGSLSRRNDDHEQASRPWDRDRDGFVLGEGAGVMMLEELEHAKARGANIYAEVSGFGMSSDAHHMTAPSPDGEGAARCMALAVSNAGLNAEDIQYINAHGTSTPAGDVAETMAVKRYFGDYAGKLAMSSTKSMIGHLLGAAGGVEAIYTALAIHHQIAPPTINLLNQDESCDLDYVANEARDLHIEAALSNSFGFGGTNGTLALSRLN